MKWIIIINIIFLVLMTKVFSDELQCTPSYLNSCKDHTVLKSLKRKAKRLLKKLKNNDRELLEKISDNHRTQFKSLNFELIKLERSQDALSRCESSDPLDLELSKKCPALILKERYFELYGLSLIDETTLIYALNAFHRDISFSNFDLLDNYWPNSRRFQYKEQTVSLLENPLNDLREKMKGLKYRLTPRQKLYTRFNSIQINAMAELLKEFNKRVQSLSSGLFYDFDADERPDEILVLDPSEQYRMTLKLLRRKLHMMSLPEGVFAGKKPTMLDLLSAAYEVQLVSNQELKVMLEFPGLVDRKTPKWKKALNMTWEMSKLVVSSIPGVNLYAIIPIVIIEGIANQRRSQNEVSDLHLFHL